MTSLIDHINARIEYLKELPGYKTSGVNSIDVKCRISELQSILILIEKEVKRSSLLWIVTNPDPKEVPYFFRTEQEAIDLLNDGYDDSEIKQVRIFIVQPTKKETT